MSTPVIQSTTANSSAFLQLSLAEWSLHRTIESGELNHLDFPLKARAFGISAVDYVSVFFGSSLMTAAEAAKDYSYLRQLLGRSKDAGINNQVLMVDHEGPLAGNDEKERLQAVDNHKIWIEAAGILECPMVRVNLHGNGTADEKQSAAIDSWWRLAEFAVGMGITILVENHGNESSDAGWLVSTIEQVQKSNIGLLPDFGNFCLMHPWGETQTDCEKAYDRYTGVKELLPFAKAVSAKTYDFDKNGEQPRMDYKKLIGLVKESGFTGFIGIEYEGFTQPEEESIRKTKALIEKYFYRTE